MHRSLQDHAFLKRVAGCIDPEAVQAWYSKYRKAALPENENGFARQRTDQFE
jgi:hypothetical protein